MIAVPQDHVEVVSWLAHGTPTCIGEVCGFCGARDAKGEPREMASGEEESDGSVSSAAATRPKRPSSVGEEGLSCAGAHD